MARKTQASSVAAPAAEVRLHLRTILESPAFRSSKRCQDFLSFVVDRSLSGEVESLRERIIGVEVFGRDPSYDTHEDSSVRVTANEVRRRLAQFYQETPQAASLRIEIPPGSYVPEYKAAAKLEAVRGWRRIGWNQRRLAIGLAALAVAAAAAWLAWPQQAVTQFWGPLLNSPEPITIQLGENHSYQLSRRLQDEFLRRHPEYLHNLEPYHLIPTPEMGLRPDDIIPVGNLSVSSADVLAVAQLGAFFLQNGHSYKLLFSSGPNTTASPGGPAVALGAFSNRWTIQLTRDLRFRYLRDLRPEGAVWMIKDQQTGKDWRLVNAFPRQNTDTDYALVTRLINPSSGRVTIAFGGLTQFGTEAAASVLTDSYELSRLKYYLGPDWPKRNLQFVIEMRVAGSAPVNPRIVIAHSW